jgi:hypothetical protein
MLIVVSNKLTYSLLIIVYFCLFASIYGCLIGLFSSIDESDEFVASLLLNYCSTMSPAAPNPENPGVIETRAKQEQCTHERGF